MSAGLEPVLTHTEKSCIALYYRQIFRNLKINTRYGYFSLLISISEVLKKRLGEVTKARGEVTSTTKIKM